MARQTGFEPPTEVIYKHNLIRSYRDCAKVTSVVNLKGPQPATAPSQFLSPKQPPTGDNRQIGEHQTEGEARHKAECLTHRTTMTTAKTLTKKM